MVSVSTFKMNRLAFLKIVSLFFCLSVITVLLSSAAHAASIQVSTDRNPVALNESFVLTYQSSDSPDGDPDFSPLEKYLNILNRSQSSNISITNGQYQSKKTWSLSVMARKAGEIILPAINFGSDQSDSIQINVRPAADNQGVQSSFYTRLKVDQEQVYAQQQIVITQQLFSDKSLSAYELGDLDFNGMDVISQSLGDMKQYQTRIGKKPYLVLERSFAIFPQSTGVLKISPVLAEARIGSGGNSFFNSFGNSKVVRVASNALEITVLPVPQNININPWLPAKSFELLEQWPQNPPKFKQGEPVTRTLSIKAEGLTAAQLPVLPDISIDGLKQYPDQPLLNDIKNDNGISGYRVEKIALIPTKAGKITLPAIDIPWWNTVTQQREVARIPAREIQIEAAAVSPANSVVTPQAATVPAVQQPLPSVAESKVTPQQLISTEPSKMWYLLTIFFAFGWLITALLWFLNSRKKQQSAEQEVNDSVSVKQAFKALKQACDKNDAVACRNQLLLWARALFPGRNILSLSDLIPLCDLPMQEALRNIDASLYGNQKLSPNFTIIIDQAKQMMQQQRNKSRRGQPQLLEPLYK